MLKNNSNYSEEQGSEEYVFCRYIVKNGKRIYPKKSQFFRFPKPKK